MTEWGRRRGGGRGRERRRARGRRRRRRKGRKRGRGRPASRGSRIRQPLRSQTLVTTWQAHGVYVTHSVTLFKGSSLRRVASEDDSVRLHFGLRGAYSIRFPDLGRSYELIGGHHNIFYAKPFAFEFVNHTPELETFGVRVAPERFVEWMNGASDEVSRFCERVAGGGKGMLFDEWAPLNPALEAVIGEMIRCPFEGKTRELFLFAKSAELFARAIDSARVPAPGRYVKTREDRERLFAARDAVNARLTDPPSLSALARTVGLNEFKLKRGFKEIFGTTVFAYLTEQRLEQAKRSLLDTDKTAAEIGYAMGYATPQHFSSAFKKWFGVTPNSMRKNT
jgi:AraC family transcriptional activator of pyochelin receptor